MMRDAILAFPEQLAFEPTVEHGPVPMKRRTVVLGMGGSHLAADLYKLLRSEQPFVIHSDYGLPAMPESDLRESLIIASSYSGNTEEVLGGYAVARQENLDLAAIAAGGKLLEKARADGVPTITLPQTGIQPRSALGFSLVAFAALLGDHELLKEFQRLSGTLEAVDLEPIGRELAREFNGAVPVVYASRMNGPIAANWKIKLNETGKVPAFMNVIPELNHNEMTGFDIVDATRALSSRFHFIFLRDPGDLPQIAKRFDVTEKLYRDRGLAVTSVTLEGASLLEKALRSCLIADWCALHLAEGYGIEAEQVPMVQELKKRIA